MSRDEQHNESPPTRLLLVDDHGTCRCGFAELLERRAGMKVVGSVSTPEGAEECLEHESPDMIIMDLRMPAMDGPALLARLRAKGYNTPVVILSMCGEQEDLAAALRAGVRGYLLKDMEPEEVLNAVRRAAKGEFVIAPDLSHKLMQLLQGQATAKQPEKLTEREREVLRHLSAGESNKVIARALNISHDTVKLHVRHILAKLGLSSRVEAAVFAVEHGEYTGRAPSP